VKKTDSIQEETDHEGGKQKEVQKQGRDVASKSWRRSIDPDQERQLRTNKHHCKVADNSLALRAQILIEW
jgi:hypothetical protein